MNRFLFLIGYRGSGKTTAGRLVAARLGCPFIDADEKLDRDSGRPIREIFATEGEPKFRDMESAVLAEVCAGPECLVSTGGGVVLREANRELMSRHGFIVWLSADADTLWERIQSDATTADRRPALAGGGLAEVEALLADRAPLYRACADVEIPVTGLSPEVVADAILAAWNSHSPKLSG